MNKKKPEELKLKEINAYSYFNNLLKKYEENKEKAAADRTPAGGTIKK